MLTKQKVFNTAAPNRSNKIIMGESSGVLNWDDIRMPQMYKLYKVMLANHWIPSEINMTNDKKQFPNLPAEEQESFKFVIGLLAVLDSMQSIYVSDVAEFLTDSSLHAVSMILGQQEVVHNQSYSYVLSSLVDKSTQDEVFEYWKTNEQLRERNEFIANGYQGFRDEKNPQTFFESLVYDIILEGLFFYTGFALFYNFARNNKMLGTSQMISYIQRDEQQHCYFFSQIFQQLLKDFPELDTEENMKFVYDTIDEAVKIESDWAHYILKNVSGIDLDEFDEYIRFIANRRLTQLGLERKYEGVDNAMPWIRPFSDESMAQTKTDFFEAKPRSYAKVSDDNGFDDL